jgi:hypothetical protein
MDKSILLLDKGASHFADLQLKASLLHHSRQCAGQPDAALLGEKRYWQG